MTADEVMFTVTRSQLLQHATAFMIDTYGKPEDLKSQDERDHFHERVGLLVLFSAFVTQTFEELQRG